MANQRPLQSPRDAQALAACSGRGQAARVAVATVLTLGGTVGEEGHQQGHVVNVLQVRPHLVDAPGQLGLEKAEKPVASGSKRRVPPPPPSPCQAHHVPPSGVGETRPSYPVAVFQEAGEVAVCRLEANEV